VVSHWASWSEHCSEDAAWLGHISVVKSVSSLHCKANAVFSLLTELKPEGLLHSFVDIIFKWLRLRCSRAGLWYPRSRVCSRPKPSDFSSWKNPQHAFRWGGSKIICPMSQLWGMKKNPALFVHSEIAGQIPLVPSFASRVCCVWLIHSASSGEGRKFLGVRVQ
jgi:hypothetical protein